MDEGAKLKKTQRLVIERLKKVAQGLPIGRPADKTTRQPWRKLGKHQGTPYFEVECDGCGRTQYFQLKKEHGVWSWRPYSPYGPRRRVIETKPLVEEIVTQKLKRVKKSTLESILDGHTHDQHDGNRPNSAKG